jgi:hypothetical protein
MNTAHKAFRDNQTLLASSSDEVQKNLNTGLLRLSEMVAALDQRLQQVQQQLQRIEGRLP